MRIGIYKDTLANGRGADVAVLSLAEGLRNRGHDAVVFEKPDLARRVAEPWDVVVSAGTNELLDLSGFKLSCPLIQQFHTNPKSQFKRKRIFRNWKIRRALRRVSAIQVLSEDFVSQVNGYGVAVAVIGNWSMRPSTVNAFAAEKMILYPAAFAKIKNHRLLIEAFGILSEEFPDWTLELYGDGPHPAAVPPAVKIFRRGSLCEAYARCAFLAFPSTDEGFGLVVAEAAMFGKPAVMLHDWIGTVAAGGGLVTAPTPEAYAEGLRQMMRNADQCRRMGENARVFCEKNYSRDIILNKWERFLTDVVGSVRCNRRAIIVK